MLDVTVSAQTNDRAGRVVVCARREPLVPMDFLFADPVGVAMLRALSKHPQGGCFLGCRVVGYLGQYGPIHRILEVESGVYKLILG
jgi:hypothetical protein